VPAHEDVVPGTPKNLIIDWAGAAAFPISVTNVPVPGCTHDGVNCGSGTGTFLTGTHQLVWKGAAECDVGISAGWTGHWWVYLVDGKGVKSQEVLWTVVCL